MKVQTFNHGSNILSVEQDLEAFLKDEEYMPKKDIVHIKTFLDSNNCYSTVIIYNERSRLPEGGI